ncbi:M48 family metallopeptidase [Actinomyces wuliandei]|uniref:M48 family metallopeptidase n=1 Tax=Actinomyces wuliandei TaxID=2057743 RepID=UPI000FDCB471
MSQPPSTPAAVPATPGSSPAPRDPQRPRIFNGSTIHGLRGTSRLRHPVEIPLLIVCILFTVVVYVLWIALIVWLALVPEPTGVGAELRDLILEGPDNSVTQLLLAAPALPLILWVARALMYAQMRAYSVQMSPTQFPEGYRMVVEAAQHFGLRRVPDAYVVLGNGVINAFAAGHGFRRFIVVHSDLFEVGGSARDPEALRFIISHEVGHHAAGHTSLWRVVIMNLVGNVPLLGPALSRTQEYTADNHGYAIAPQGTAGAMGLLTAGKYLGAQVNTHALADRATREKGLWLHLVNWGATHPVNTWRAHALRDRSRPGRIMIRPKESTAWFPPTHPAGSDWSDIWPTPAQVLERLDSTRPLVPAEEQFGRYPGVTYQVPRDQLRWASPVPVPTAPSGFQPSGYGFHGDTASGAQASGGAAPSQGTTAAPDSRTEPGRSPGGVQPGPDGST